MRFEFSGIGEFYTDEEALQAAHGLMEVHEDDLDRLLPGATILSQKETTHELWDGSTYFYFEGVVDVPLVRSVFEFAGAGTDCDTCGCSWDEGILVVSDLGHVLKTRYGCYSGDYISTITSPTDETKQTLRDELTRIRTFMSGPFEEAFKALGVVG